MAVAPAAGREIDALAAPFPRQRPHVLRGNAGLLLLPFRRLGDAVFLADEISLPLVEADGVGLHVFLVVEALFDPDIGDRHRHRDRGGGPGRKPLARQELRRSVVVRVDVNDFDAELGVLQPLPAHRAFLRAVGAAGALGVRSPEHDHVAVLQAVLDRAVGLRLTDAKRVAPVVDRAPVPAFPAVGIVVDLRIADRIAETEQRGEIIADIAPGMVRAVRDRHHAGSVRRLESLDLAGDEVERLLPGDAHITRLAAVLRVALALRIEIDALHRVKQPIGRIDDRLRILTMGRKRRLPGRRKLEPARLDGPRRRIVVAEIDRRHANDLAVLDVDEDRPAIGHIAVAHGAIREADADLQTHALAHHDGLGEPVGEILRAVDRELEILLRVDLIEPVDWRHQQIGAERGVLEGKCHVGVRAQSVPRRHFAVADGVPAADLFVARLELRHKVALLESRLEDGIPPGRELE